MQTTYIGPVPDLPYDLVGKRGCTAAQTSMAGSAIACEPGQVALGRLSRNAVMNQLVARISEVVAETRP